MKIGRSKYLWTCEIGIIKFHFINFYRKVKSLKFFFHPQCFCTSETVLFHIEANNFWNGKMIAFSTNAHINRENYFGVDEDSKQKRELNYLLLAQKSFLL